MEENIALEMLPDDQPEDENLMTSINNCHTECCPDYSY